MGRNLRSLRIVVSTLTVLATMLMPMASFAPVAQADSNAINFESYSLGTVHGQDGWSSFGAAGSGCAVYDHAISSSLGTAGFGAKSLRISNAVTSGCLSDQTFSKSLLNEAGETDALNGGFSGGTRQPHFEAQFDIASTVPNAQQQGLTMSVSPDRGDGARMSYLRFEDNQKNRNSGGIDVFFDDVQGTSNPANFVETKIASGLPRNVPHTVKFAIDFVDGPSNDVVKIYIDGALVHTGTTWENYYRYDSESSTGNNSRTVDSLAFLTRGTAAPATSGKGYLIDNLSLSSGPIPGPDLVAVKTNNAPNGVQVGGMFTWTIHVANIGTSDASVNPETYLFQDKLPAGSQISYSNLVQSTNGVTGTVSCSLKPNGQNQDIVCLANTHVTMPAGSSFDVSVDVKVNSGDNPSKLDNPRSSDYGACAADPNRHVTETNEDNNKCSNSVSVTQPTSTPTATPLVCDQGQHVSDGQCVPDPTPTPAACPMGTAESFVEHDKVNPDGAIVASGVLTAGDYLLRASGSYVYRPNSPGATLSDPAFSERDPNDTVYGGAFVPWVSVNSFPAPYQGWLGIQVNPSSTGPTSEPVPWGNVYDAGHNYSALISSWAGGAMKFRILDDVYSDNSGNLSVDIYQCKAPEAPVCNTELVTNGDFESPAITESAGWQIFTSGLIGLNWYATWLNPGPAERPEVANVELQSQNVLSGWTVAPTNGQYTELDTDWLKTGTSDGFAHSNSAIELYQNIPTETGKSYTLSFLAAARPDAPAGDNVLEALQNGISLAVLNLTDKEFKSFAYTFTAAGTTTKISFKDAGNPDDSFGPLVDNVSLKKDCAPTPQHTTYSGMKFNDANRNGIKDPGEQGLSGWTIWVGTQDEEGTHIANSMTTGADGTYTLYMPDGQVPRGGWTIGETQQTGWTQTFPEGGVYKGRQDRSESGLDFGNYQYQQPPEPLFWVEEDTTSVKVDWMPSAGADGYRVYRSNDNVTYTQIADVTGTSYTDATVAANSDHYYKVTAYQGTAENDPTTIMGKYAGTKDIVIDDNAMSADVGGSGTFAHSEGWGVYSVLTPGAETILQNAVGGDNYSTLDPYTGQTASWTTNATLDGTYEVYAQYICDPSRSQANYDIYSGTTKVGSASLIQAKNNQAGADCAPQSASTQPTWQSLGEYSFNGQGQVRLVSASPYASNGTRYILADAVGFRYIAPNCDEGQHWDGQSCVKDDDGDNGGNSQTSGLRRTHNDSLDNGTPTPTPEVTPTPTPTPAQGGGTEVTPTPTPTPTPPANPPHGNGGNGSGNKPPKNGSLGNLAAGETPTPTPSVSPSVSPLELPNPLAAAMGTGFLGLGWPWYWWLLILVIIAIIVWYWRRRK